VSEIGTPVRVKPPNGVFRVGGYVLTDRKVSSVLIADDRGSMRGAAITGYRRCGGDPGEVGWRGYADYPADKRPLRAFARCEDGGLLSLGALPAPAAAR
jgi:hypothetical protein